MSKFAALFAALASAATAAAATAPAWLPTAAAVAGTVATGVGIAAQHQAQRQQRMDQEKANRDWLAYQDEARQRFQAVEDTERDKATTEALDFAKEGDIGNRMADINARTQELEQQYTPAPIATSDLMFANQAAGEDKSLNAYAGKQVAAATAEARKRIQALARVGGYGGHMTQKSRDLADAGERIGDINDVRAGSLRALERVQQVPLEQINYESTGLAEALTAIGPQVAGMGFGRMGGLPTSSGVLDANGMPVKPITGITRPMPRPANFQPLG
jgi:hypothetical protein